MQRTNAEMLASVVRKIIDDKGLSSYDVARNAKGGIDQSTVNRIKNARIKNPAIPTLQALAKGLGVAEEIILIPARGARPEPAEFEKKVLYLIAEADNWSEEQKERFLQMVTTIVAGIRQERILHPEDVTLVEIPEGKPLNVDRDITQPKKKRA